MTFPNRQTQRAPNRGIRTNVEGELHCRILYMALLDAISRAVFSQEPNRDRFVNFVPEFCAWAECNRLSLSHLYKLVGKKVIATNCASSRFRNSLHYTSERNTGLIT